MLAGRLIDELAEAEHHAGKGEVVLDAVGARGARRSRRCSASGGRDPASGATVGVVAATRRRAPRLPSPRPTRCPRTLVRPWLLPAVYERLRTGRGEFLAELRPAFPLFLRFGGIDYDDDDRRRSTSSTTSSRRAQRVLAGYGGNLLQLTLGDKGAYLYAVFGSPHRPRGRRRARRARPRSSCAALDGVTAARDLQIGITHGRLRSGTYGHAMRRTFVCLGDAVNLAARLMSAAPPGSIYVVRAGRTTRPASASSGRRSPPLAVKGKRGARRTRTR